MMNPLGYFRALFWLLTTSIESKFPSLAKRRALSPALAAGAIAAIIAIGAIIIYILVVTPASTTTSTHTP